jgi:hypothetical protein
MRKKSLRHLFFGWLMLFGMLFHVLVAHHDGTADLLLSQRSDGQIILESGLRHASHHAKAHHPDEHPDHEAEHHALADPDHDTPAHSHHHLTLDHPEAYTCPSTTEAQDLLSLRLISLLASLPVWIEVPQAPVKLASLWEIPEPKPPPEQIRLALTTTVLLI